MTSLLQLDDLRLRVNRDGDASDILRGVSFTVENGEAVGIVGESGSGKTLTVRSVIGLSPDNAEVSGTISVDGRDVVTMNGQELMHLRRETAGMIFQDPHAAINPVHRIGDFLTETYRSSSRAERRSAATRAAELLREVQIDDADRVMGLYPHQVSGGMLQRVMIASVLMRDPQLILADEPTTALDVTTQAEVVALLDQIRRERGTALVFISHDIELVASLCDRILVMYQGRIIEHLTRAELRSGANLEPYTQTLLDCRPDITRRRHRLPVTASSVIDERYAELL